MAPRVAAAISSMRHLETLASDRLDIELDGLKMLDVGAGQLVLQATYFSLRNTVVAIDQDVIVHGLNIAGYAKMMRENGRKRLVKTLGRKILLVDSRYHREMRRQLGVLTLSQPEIFQMDATAMAFPNQSFDFVYALLVLQSLRDPAAALDEMIRVLRPGGGLYVDLTLYTSPGGSLDIRLLGGGQSQSLPRWAHLEPSMAHLPRSNAYVSTFRLRDWKNLFEGRMIDVEIGLDQPGAAELEDEARVRWARGELTDYSLDELLTNRVSAMWRKPSAGAADVASR